MAREFQATHHDRPPRDSRVDDCLPPATSLLFYCVQSLPEITPRLNVAAHLRRSFLPPPSSLLSPFDRDSSCPSLLQDVARHAWQNSGRPAAVACSARQLWVDVASQCLQEKIGVMLARQVFSVQETTARKENEPIAYRYKVCRCYGVKAVRLGARGHARRALRARPRSRATRRHPNATRPRDVAGDSVVRQRIGIITVRGGM